MRGKNSISSSCYIKKPECGNSKTDHHRHAPGQIVVKGGKPGVRHISRLDTGKITVKADDINFTI